MTTAFESNLGRRVTAGMRAQALHEGVSFETIVARHDQRLAIVYKSAYIAGSLLSGLWLWLFFRRDHLYLAQHMVTALHLSCIGMTCLVCADIVQAIGTGGATRNPTAVGGGTMGMAAIGVYPLLRENAGAGVFARLEEHLSPTALRDRQSPRAAVHDDAADVRGQPLPPYNHSLSGQKRHRLNSSM
jgi:hypothetical protein